MNDDELAAWHRAQADQRHQVHLANAERARIQAQQPPVNPQAEIQRAQQAYWDHEARTRRPTDNLLQRDAQYQANPNHQTRAQRDLAHQNFLDARYGYDRNRPAVDPNRYPQAAPVHHHWWQVWKR